MFQWFVCQKYSWLLLLFACIVRQISCFFKNRSKKPFFEVPSADLSSKTCFLEHFGSQGALQKQPLGDMFGQKGTPGWGPPNRVERPEADLGRIWCRKHPKHRFGTILDQFWSKFACISDSFKAILAAFPWFVCYVWNVSSGLLCCTLFPNQRAKLWENKRT